MVEWLLIFFVGIPVDTVTYPPWSDSAFVAEYYNYRYAGTDSSKYSFRDPPTTHERRGWMIREFDNMEHLSFTLRHELYFAPRVIQFDSLGRFHRFNVQQIMLFDSVTPEYVVPSGKYEMRLIEIDDGFPDTIFTTVRDTIRDTVFVTDTVVTEPEPTYESVYADDALTPPWMFSGWGATVTYNAKDQFIFGTAMRATLKAWGAVGFRRGSWGNELPLRTDEFTAFRFAVYAPTSVKTSIRFTGTSTRSIHAVTFDRGWNDVVIPMSDVTTPDIVDVWIQNYTNSSVTLNFDEIRVVK